MPSNRVLILGGTREARELAAALLEAGFDTETSLAGVTEKPALPAGRLRRGGFGGVEGLAAYLRAENVAAVIDSTHPFAIQISSSAHQAAGQVGVPLVRLERPAWQSGPEDHWLIVQSAAEAAAALPPGARAFVTIGRKETGWFFERSDISGIARMIEAFQGDAGGSWRLIFQRPPFDITGEIELLTRNNVTHVVAKNSGGSDTFAKIVAARQLRLPLVMIARPRKPEIPTYGSVHDVVLCLQRQLLS